MAQIIQPPTPLPEVFETPSIFLAGSIAQGQAALWQDHLANALSDLPLTILNPRRIAWDASWEQRADVPHFREQVEWELHAQHRADLVVFYFDPSTPSPITLLELGLAAGANKRAIILCPDGFWRKGNVDIICDAYGLIRANSWDEFVTQIRDEFSDSADIDTND